MGFLSRDDLGDDVGEGVEEGGLQGCFDDGWEGHGRGYEGEMAPDEKSGSLIRDVKVVEINGVRRGNPKSWSASGVGVVDE